MTALEDIPFNTSLKNPIDELAEVKESPIHGWGIFAKKYIPEGTIWWHARPCDVQILTRDQFQRLMASRRNEKFEQYIETLLTYSYYAVSFDVMVLCLDNMRYLNHNADDNSGALETCPDFCSITLRDVRAGEELKEDYRKYAKCSWVDKYKPQYHCTEF